MARSPDHVDRTLEVVDPGTGAVIGTMTVRVPVGYVPAA